MTLGENSPITAPMTLESITQTLSGQDSPSTALEYMLLSWDHFVNELEFE